MLRIELQDGDRPFRPGSTLNGTVAWQFASAPSEITATLGWYTEGKGNIDGDTVVEQTWKPSSEQGSQKFQWTLPRGPMSWNGTLIRVRWHIEVESTDPDELEECEISIACNQPQ